MYIPTRGSRGMEIGRTYDQVACVRSITISQSSMTAETLFLIDGFTSVWIPPEILSREQ